MSQPEFLDADAGDTASTELPSFAKVFYAIEKNHSNKLTYIYSEEGRHEAMKFYNEQQEFLRTNHSSDTYISGVIGKLKGHCHRLAMVIQALEDGCKLLMSAGQMNPGVLDKDFKDKIKQTVSEDYVYNYKISLDSTKRAITMTNYFLQHKKFLSGYNVSGVVEIQPTLSTLAKKIMLQPGNTVYCNVITRNSRCTAEQVKNEMKKLAAEGLGTTMQEKPQGGGRLMVTFKKLDTDNLNIEQSATLTSKLASYGLNYIEYANSLDNNTENIPPQPIKRLKVADNVDN